jgi:hypothetical protein
MPTQQDAADLLIEAIDASGGITRIEKGLYAPVAAPDWTDLAQVYLVACAERCVDPVVADTAGSDSVEDEEGDEDEDFDPP